MFFLLWKMEIDIRIFFYIYSRFRDRNSHRLFKYRNCRFMKKARNGLQNIYIENMKNINVLSEWGKNGNPEIIRYCFMYLNNNFITVKIDSNHALHDKYFSSHLSIKYSGSQRSDLSRSNILAEMRR